MRNRSLPIWIMVFCLLTPAAAHTASALEDGASTNPVAPHECEAVQSVMAPVVSLGLECVIIERLLTSEPKWAQFIQTQFDLMRFTSPEPKKLSFTVDAASSPEFSRVQPDVTEKDEIMGTEPGNGSWRELVARYFAAGDVEYALRVIACESGGDPGAVNPRSGASGLFQHLPRYWSERSAKAGWSGASVFDPVANVAVAAWMVYEMPGGGWSHWVCKG